MKNAYIETSRCPFGQRLFAVRILLLSRQSAAASAAIVVTAATVIACTITAVTAAAEQKDKNDNPATVTAKVETRHNNVLLVRI